MFKPRIELYHNINQLDAIAKNTDDEFVRNKIRIIMMDIIIKGNKQMFYLINKFISSEGITKGAYADVILMKMKGEDYEFPDNITKDILENASIDALMYYGAESLNFSFSERCKIEFYKRATLFEDKEELIKKKLLDRKGENNDKHKRR